jgi:penicillin-binding protein 1A
LLRSIGIEYALNHAKLFGFDPNDLPKRLSLALGSGTVTPLQMAQGYAVLANGGFKVEPYFIQKILNGRDEVLYEAKPLTVCSDCPQSANLNEEGKPIFPANAPTGVAPRVISPQNYFLMNSMMRDVIQHGTATKAKELGRKDIAGKTGTTNDQRDAWFNGFNRSHVAIVWVGFDSSSPLGSKEVGGMAALPAWIKYMREILKDVKEQPLEMPTNMAAIRIDPKTGNPAPPWQKNAIYEVFREEYAPEIPNFDASDSFATEGALPGGQEESSELF